MTSLLAYGDCILVAPKKMEEATPSGLIIPTKTGYKNEGIVYSVGRGKFSKKGVRLRPDVEVGDNIIFDKLAGIRVKLNGVQMILIRAHDVIAVMENETETEGN
jgi:chaperonin GroES